MAISEKDYFSQLTKNPLDYETNYSIEIVVNPNNSENSTGTTASKLLEEMGNPQNLQGPEALIFLSRLCSELSIFSESHKENFDKYFRTQDWRNNLSNCIGFTNSISDRFSSLNLTINHKDPDEKININFNDIYQVFIDRLISQGFSGRLKFSNEYLDYLKEFTQSMFEAFSNGDLYLIAKLYEYDKENQEKAYTANSVDEVERLHSFVQSQKRHVEQVLPEIDFKGFLCAYNGLVINHALNAKHTEKFNLLYDSHYLLEFPELNDEQFAELQQKIKQDGNYNKCDTYQQSKRFLLRGRTLEQLLTSGIIDHQLIKVIPYHDINFSMDLKDVNNKDLFGVEYKVKNSFNDAEIKEFNEKAAFEQQKHFKYRLPYLSHVSIPWQRQTDWKSFRQVVGNEILTFKRREKLRSEFVPPVKQEQQEMRISSVQLNSTQTQGRQHSLSNESRLERERANINIEQPAEPLATAKTVQDDLIDGQDFAENVSEPEIVTQEPEAKSQQETEQPVQGAFSASERAPVNVAIPSKTSYEARLIPAPAKEAGIDRLMINIAHLSAHSDLMSYLGIKSLPAGQGLTLKGEDALNFVRAVHAADRARALDPTNLSNASTVDFSIALEGDDVDLLGKNVHYTLGTLSGGGSSRSLLSSLAGMSFEGNNYTDEHKVRIDNMIAENVNKLPERDVLTVEEVPPVVHADEFAVLDQSVLDREIIERNKEREEELKNRIYLDYIPNRLYTWATSPRSPVTYDREKNQYFISTEAASLPENMANVSKCLFKREIYADDFLGAVTEGKVALANALNVKNPTQREYAIAEALNICAKESAANIPGAIHDFREIEQIRKMQGRPIGFFKAFSESHKYYTAVLKLKKQMKLEKKLNRDDFSDSFTSDKKEKEVRNLNRKAVMCLMRQAAFNVTHSLPNRVRTAGRFLQTPNADSMSYLADALADYVTGKALYDGKRITYGYFEDRFPLHNSQTFASDVKKHLFNAGLDLSKPQFAQLNLDVERLCERACKLCDEFNEKVSQCRGSNDRSRKAMIDDLVKKADDFRQSVHTEFTQTERERRTLRVFNGELEPLYLAVPAEKRTALLNENKEICEEALTGALCVENNAQNRQKFALFLPQITDKFELSKDAEKMREQVRRELRDVGFCEETIKNLRSGKWTTDKMNSSLSYVFNLDGVPRLQINDFNGSLKKTVILGRPDEKQRAELKENYAKYKASQEALTLQQKAERSKQISEILSKVQIPEQQVEQKYLMAKGLSIADVPNAYVDRDGSVAQKLTGFTPEYARKTLDGALICPLTNAQGKVISAQIIDKDLNKLNLSGAPMKGAFFTVGGYDKIKDCDTILVAEGIATAASIAKVAPPGVAVVACMSANNMEHVTRTLLYQYPDKGFGLMADNDIHTEADKLNAGMEQAYKTKAALMPVRSNLTLKFPPLTSKQLLEGKSDFNDALQLNPQAVRDRVVATVGEIRKEQKRIESARNAAQMRVNDDFLVETAHRKAVRRA